MGNIAATEIQPLTPSFAFGVALHLQILEGASYEQAYATVTSRGAEVEKCVESWAKLNATGRETVLGIISRRLARSTREERGLLLTRAAAGLC